MDSAHQEKFDKLKGLQGADFDKEYDSIQQSAHKDAVDLFSRYGKSGDNKDLKAFAMGGSGQRTVFAVLALGQLQRAELAELFATGGFANLSAAITYKISLCVTPSGTATYKNCRYFSHSGLCYVPVGGRSSVSIRLI